MISFNKHKLGKKHSVFKNKTLKATISIETGHLGVKYVEIRPRGFVLPNQTDSLKIRKTDYANFSEQRIKTFLTVNFGIKLGEALFWYIAETCFKLKLQIKVVFT